MTKRKKTKQKTMVLITLKESSSLGNTNSINTRDEKAWFSNLVHCEVYSIQHYVIKLSVTWDRSVVFSMYSVSSINKTDSHDITKILLTEALDIINHKPTIVSISYSFLVSGIISLYPQELCPLNCL